MKVRDLLFLSLAVLLLATFYVQASERPPWCLTGAGGLVFGAIGGMVFVWARRRENDAPSRKRCDVVAPAMLPLLILWLGLSGGLGAVVSPVAGVAFFLTTTAAAIRIVAADRPPSPPADEVDPRDPRFDRETRGTEELGDAEPQGGTSET